MSLLRKIFYQTFIHFSGKIISLFLGLVSFALLARYLGKEGYGNFTTVIAFLQTFAIFADLGLYLVLLEMLGKEKNEEKIFANFLTLRIFSSLLFLAPAPLIAFFIPVYPKIVKIGILVTLFAYFFSSLISLFTALFEKHLKVQKVIWAEILGKTSLLVFVLITIFLKLNLLFIFLAVILGSLVNLLILYFFSFKFLKIKFDFDLPLIKEIIKKSYPLALTVIFTALYFKGDTIILSLFRTQEEVGLYGASYRVLEVLIAFPPIFMGLVLPFLSRAISEKNLESFKSIIQKSFDFLSLLGLPLIFGVQFLGREILTFLAGKEFAISGDILKVLIFAVFLIFLSCLFSYGVVALEKQKEMIKFYFLTCLVALTFYLIFIPKFSYYGAATGTILAEFLTALFCFLIVFKYTHFFPSLKVFSKAISACLTMSLFLYFSKNLNLILALILAVGIYFLSLYLFKAVERKTIKEILRI